MHPVLSAAGPYLGDLYDGAVGANSHLSLRPRESRIGLLRALAGSCHLQPALAVTIVGAALAAIARNSTGTTVLLTLAVLTGQLSIGWSNDLIDADRDAAAGRRDKPIAAGVLPRPVVRTAIIASLAATVVFSLLLGWRAGIVHLAAVATAWSYNLGIKATVASWLPYLVAFGLLPAVATLATSAPHWPAWWAMAASALLGVAAHFANVLPDRVDDLSTGVRGLPHRLPARVSAVVGPIATVAASALAMFAPPGPPRTVQWPVFGAAIAVAGFALVCGLRAPTQKLPFYATMAAAALDILLLAIGGHQLG